MGSVARDIFFDTVKALERQAAGVQVLSRYARSGAKRDQLLTELLIKVMEIVGADAGAISIANESAGVFDFAAVQWAGMDAVEAAAKERALKLFKLKLTEGVLGQVYQSREPVIVPDVSKNTAFRREMSEAVQYDILNLLAVPIQTDETRVGVLELFNKVPKGTFSANDMELAVALGYQIALVLDVHRLRLASSDLAPKPPPPPPPPPAPAVPPAELQEARRAARDAQTQLQESKQLLDSALQVQDQYKQQIKSLTEELARVKSVAEAATPAQQMMRLLRSVEPIAFTLSLESVLKNFAELAGRLVNAQATQIFLWEERGERFTLAHSSAPSSVGKGVIVSFKKGEGLAGFSGERMELVQVEDVTRDDHFSKSIDEVPGVLTKSVLAGPLAANGRLIGVIEAINRRDGAAFTAEDSVALAGLALMGAAALEKVLAYRETLDAVRQTFGAISDLVDSRNPLETGRAERLRQTVMALGESVGMGEQDLRDLEWAALLCNMGEIPLPLDLPTKRGELTEREQDQLLNVPNMGAQIFNPIPALAGVARIIRHLHERWDSMGYPDRLSGDAIPLGSRVIAVAELFDGLVSGGPGRKPLPVDVALKEVEACSGKQFDPACVDSLLRLSRSGRLKHGSSRSR